MKGSIEFVDGPLCGKVARGYVGMPSMVTDWSPDGTAVAYQRRDFDDPGAARPMVSAAGNRMYEFVR